MDNSKNMEPGIRNATVQESPNKEQRKKESRPVISAKVQTILVVSEILPFVVLANRSKSTFYKILYHETKF